MQPIHLPAERHQYSFDPHSPPALTIDPGATVVVETLDCFSNRLSVLAPPLRDERDVLAHIGGRYNPVNAPIYVRGAEPGDQLAVDIVEVALGSRDGFAVTHVAHDWATGFGGRSFADHVAPASIFAAIEGNRVGLTIAGIDIDYAARPMIGTIGTAPAGEAVSSLFYGADHGGNLDCPHIRPGATVILPVNVPGGLLSLGDVHALMGEGEVTGTALETSADVTICIRLLKRDGARPLLPRLIDAEGLGAIGCISRTSLQDNIGAAVRDLMAMLQQEFALNGADALQLVNLFGRITINQAVGEGAQRWLSVLVRLLWSDLAPLERIRRLPASALRVAV